eukprot:m.45304 g.45304  ORF g.45304 m.45304 type:complete len:513 (-) comp12172_c1_seq1:41-1579(-)
MVTRIELYIHDGADKKETSAVASSVLRRAASRCSKSRLVTVTAVVFLLALCSLYVMTLDDEEWRAYGERIRMLHDKLTCSPIISDVEPEEVDLGFPDGVAELPQTRSLKARQKQSILSPSSSLSSSSQPPLVIPTPLKQLGYRPPTIYIADSETWAIYDQSTSSCGTAELSSDEYHLYQKLRANVTHSIVSDPAQADWIYIPYFSNVACANPAPFNAIFEAVRHLGQRFILFTERPWNDRTQLKTETEKLLHKYPQIVFWSPEIKTLTSRSLRNDPFTFSRHVVVPQAPLDIDVYPKPFLDVQENDRPFEYCFQGTLLMQQRVVASLALKERKDSFVLGNCRRDRTNMRTGILASGNSRKLYAQCNFCIMPMGDSLSDRRLFDAMSVGCVPVIFEGLKPLPFAQFMDYNNFTLYLPEPESVEDVHTFMVEQDFLLTPDVRHAMRTRMLAAVRSMSFSPAHNYAGLHYALALTLLSPMDDDMTLQQRELQEAAMAAGLRRNADLEGWWGISTL